MQENPTTPPKLYLESPTRIRFEDCDPFGHLNNGRYIDYFLNAREDQLRDHYQLDIYQHMQRVGKAWVAASNQISYLREVKYNEEVTVRTSLRWFTDSDLLTEGIMLNPETQEVKSVIWMRFVYIDVRKGAKAVHEDSLMDLYRSVATDGEGKPNVYFEERVRELRAAAAGA